jgi:hypothetical protein
LRALRAKVRYDRKAKLTRWTFKRRFRRALPAGRYKLDVRGSIRATTARARA